MRAMIKPNSLFGEHAVLQQGVPVPVWGIADSDEPVTVEFNGQQKQTIADKGRWMIQLDPMKAGGPYSLTISGKDNRIEINDIYVGEVWVCSGQSNMERQLRPRPPQPLITGWEQERDAADYPLIREYHVPISTADEPVEDIGSKWVVCSPGTVRDFSCVGYFFARDLYKALNVPVGMIFSAVGGTPAEFWTSRAGLESHPEFKTPIEKYEHSLMNYPKQLARYKREGSTGNIPVNPAERGHVYGHYNAMVAPLQPYAIKGVIWYQGENNAHNPEQYKTLFPLMIKNWRDTWAQGSFPFLFVQIAPFKNMPPEIREAQLVSLKSTKNTAMVVTTDCGDANDIHPPHKQPVGYRLSLAARALAYGEKLEYSGPLYEFMEIKGNKAILYFSHSSNGMASRNGTLKGFTIAGKDGNFVPAGAYIKNNMVIVTNPSVKEPVAVRYGWENVPDVNLYNKEGLPASPFRTD
jgi:sialate O-acetylesterase